MPRASSNQSEHIGTIFVPTSNRYSALKKCLDSLDKQTIKKFEVIIVGKGKDSKVCELVKGYKKLNIKYISQEKPGLIGAANEAISCSRGKYFSRIDDDVILSKNWYKNLLISFKDKSVGGVTGPTIMSARGLRSRDLTKYIEDLKNSKNPFLRTIFQLYFDYLYEGKLFEVSQFLEGGFFTIGSNYPGSSKIKKLTEVSNLEACNWSARLRILKQIGGFDEIYLKGLGDFHEADAALKIKKLGFKLIFNPNVKLRHNVEDGKVESARPNAFYRIQNFIIFYFRFFRIRSTNQFIKLFINLFIQNVYYVYKFVITGSLDQLGAVIGTIVGLARVIIRINK